LLQLWSILASTSSFHCPLTPTTPATAPALASTITVDACVHILPCSARHIARARRRRSRDRRSEWTVTTEPWGSAPLTSGTIAPIWTPAPTFQSPRRSLGRKPPPPSSSSRIITRTISKDCRIAKTGSTTITTLPTSPNSLTYLFIPHSLLYYISFSIASFNNSELSGLIYRIWMSFTDNVVWEFFFSSFYYSVFRIGSRSS